LTESAAEAGSSVRRRVLISFLRPRATWRVAGRSSTPISCRCRCSGTVVTRTTNCGLAAHGKPAKLRQKDRDARWTKKHGRSFFGYKNHVNADAKHKLIRHYAVGNAAVHDSQKLDGLLDKGTCNDVFAAKECRSPCLAYILLGCGVYLGRIFVGRAYRRSSGVGRTKINIIAQLDASPGLPEVSLASDPSFYTSYRHVCRRFLLVSRSATSPKERRNR
jgi:hypothetical protein